MNFQHCGEERRGEERRGEEMRGGGCKAPN